MLKNFLKTTFRNFLKNKSYVFINLLGLSLTLACCIVAYLNFKFAIDFDNTHQNRNSIYKIQSTKKVQDEEILFGITPLALASNIANQQSEIEHHTRYISTSFVIKKDQKVFDEAIAFGDDDFFEMFTFPLKYGDTNSFLDPGNILLSEQTANKLFGSNYNPVGQLISLINDDGIAISKRVGGVLKPIPLNSTLRFDAFMHFDNYLTLKHLKTNDWSKFIGGTFIMTKENFSADQLKTELDANYLSIQNQAREDWKISQYTVDSFATLASNSPNIRAYWMNKMAPSAVYFIPFILAILMLLIACFNFTNTSIAISSKRLKEIGLRKVMGGSKTQLIFQFMGENMALSIAALILSIALALYLTPLYSSLWSHIDLQLNLFESAQLYFFLFGLLLFTSIIAGAYPSILISSFQPVKILKGNQLLGGTSTLSKILIASQFALTTIALIASFAFSQNAQYQNSLDLGYEKTDIISVQVENESEYQRLTQRIEQNPMIRQIASTSNHIGKGSYSRVLKNQDTELEGHMLRFGLDYAEIMDLKIKEGRYFSDDLSEHDERNSIVVNETLVKEFGWTEPIGQTLQIGDSIRLEVIGVMQDFYMNGLLAPIAPFGIRLASTNDTRFAVIRVNNTRDLQSTYDFLQSSWLEMEPNKPFNGAYQDSFLRDADQINHNVSIMFSFLGGLALILSTIGLYSLVSLNILKRTQEIGVRKVLGASVWQIISQMNTPFAWTICISLSIGALLAYVAINQMMSLVFTYYQPVTPYTILFPLLISMLVTFITAVGKTTKAAISNPIHSLKHE